MRLFDILVSLLLLVPASFFFAAIAVLIKLDSPGPVFFVQERVGKGWRRFRMFKFRKMFHAGTTGGPGVTARYDPRITRVGSWLERSKLDELPQLINVLLGDMSLVGPRPEIPQFTGEPHTELWNRVLSVKPGIFGPNQILHRNESELFPDDCQEVEAYYVEHILPKKLEVDAAYAERKSVLHDVGIIVRGVWATLAGTITMETIRTRRLQIAHLFACVALGELTLAAAFLLRFDWEIPAGEMPHLYLGLALMAVARLVCFHQFAIHRSIHSFFNLFDAMRICASVAVGTVFGVAIQFLLNFRALSRAIFLVDGMILAVTLIGLSYLADRALATLRRDRKPAEEPIRARLGWSAAAGAAGVVAMLYSLAFFWPGVFVGHAFDLICILGVAFLSRAVLFPFLARRFPVSDRFVVMATRDARPLIRHCALTFVVDITVVFFLNIRDFSRGAVILNALLYALLLVFVLTVRCMWGRKFRRAAAPRVTEPVARGNVLVVGDGREVGYLVDALRHNGADRVQIAGVVTADATHRTRRVHGIDVVGTTRNLGSVIEAKGASLVMLLEDSIEASARDDVLRACETRGVDVRVVPSVMRFVEASDDEGDGAREEPEPVTLEPR